MNFNLFDTLLDGVIVLNAQKEVIYCNDAAQFVGGRSTNKIRKGTKLRDVLRIKDLDSLFKPRNTSRPSEGSELSLYQEYSFDTEDGEIITIQISVQSQEFEKGLHNENEGKWIVFIRDVTLEAALHNKYKAEIEKKESVIKQLQEAQEQLLQIGKTAILGQFVASITHELNNPLTYLLSSAESLTQMFDEGNMDISEARIFVNHINKGVMRILQISNHLKTFLHKPLSPKDLIYSDLHEVMERAISFTQHYSSKHNITVQNNVPLCLPRTLMDPTLIEQIAINLIRNSVDALTESPETQKFLIELNGKYDEKDNSITISFTDHGPGIPSDVMKKLFTPFFTTKPIGKGTGLGLNICTSIAEKHGGSLTVSSTLGEGATFSLTLPIRVPEEIANKESQNESLEGVLKGRKILLVDDEPNIRAVQKNILSKHGCQVYEANNGVEALERCREQKPDVTITDLIMAEMTGIEFAEKAKELYGDMKIILLTGSVALQNLGEYRSLFDDLVQKPFPKESIRKAVLNVLEKRITH